MARMGRSRERRDKRREPEGFIVICAKAESQVVPQRGYILWPGVTGASASTRGSHECVATLGWMMERLRRKEGCHCWLAQQCYSVASSTSAISLSVRP
jgi:hypothetical protein